MVCRSSVNGVDRKFANVATKKSSWLVMTHDKHTDKSLALPTSRCILFDGENI